MERVPLQFKLRSLLLVVAGAALVAYIIRENPGSTFMFVVFFLPLALSALRLRLRCAAEGRKATRQEKSIAVAVALAIAFSLIALTFFAAYTIRK